MDALNVLRLCERFHVLPSTLYDEESDLFDLLEIEYLVKGGDDGEQS